MQITVTDVPQLIPAGAQSNGTALKGLTIQQISGSPVEFAPRATLTYGGALGGLRLAAGAPGGNATPVRPGIYVVCGTGLTAVLAYEYC